MDAEYFLINKDTVKFDLPIDAVLPQLLDKLSNYGRVVLQAPPGAGKTTRAPLAILKSGLCDGKILMLEPRRLAAQTAAEHMADTLGEPIGATVGYRIRGQTKIGPNTRIEVLTEGILTQMVLLVFLKLRALIAQLTFVKMFGFQELQEWQKLPGLTLF